MVEQHFGRKIGSNMSPDYRQELNPISSERRRDMNPSNQLMSVIKDSLNELETRGDIVITSGLPNSAADFLYDSLQTLLPTEALTVQELIGLRSLIFHAIADKRFFDWEMPTLTGFDSEGFARIADKLPKG